MTTKFTDRYGALTSIVDSTTSYSFTDSKGDTYTFEVYPINITKDDINNALEQIKNPRIWFVVYKTSITPPTERQIKHALTEGLLLVLSINCTIIDNYGIPHQVIYNKEKEKYEIMVSKISQLIDKTIKVSSFSDRLITVIKDSEDPSSLVVGLDNSTRIILNNLYGKIDEQEEIITNLQNNSGGGSELEMKVLDLERRLQELEMRLGR
jgi:hypothetical protein